MNTASKHIPVLQDQAAARPGHSGKLQTLNDLEDLEVPALNTLFNTCTRSGVDRRQLEDRRRSPRPNCEERRSGRDRRIMTYL